MACDLETTQAAACESGIGKVGSPISLLQLIAQLSCEIADAGGGGGTPGGADTQVQYNDGGAFGGFGSFDDATNLLLLPGSLSVGDSTTHFLGLSATATRDYRLTSNAFGLGTSTWMLGLYDSGAIQPAANSTLFLESIFAARANIIMYGAFLANGQSAFTVIGLPAAGTAGRRSHVTDALGPAFGAAVVGGGAVVVPVFDDGTNWIVG